MSDPFARFRNPEKMSARIQALSRRKAQQRRTLRQLNQAVVYWQACWHNAARLLSQQRTEIEGLKKELAATRKKVPWWKS